MFECKKVFSIFNGIVESNAEGNADAMLSKAN
jgi:hypothetical protein